MPWKGEVGRDSPDSESELQQELTQRLGLGLGWSATFLSFATFLARRKQASADANLRHWFKKASPILSNDPVSIPSSPQETSVASMNANNLSRLTPSFDQQSKTLNTAHEVEEETTQREELCARDADAGSSMDVDQGKLRAASYPPLVNLLPRQQLD